MQLKAELASRLPQLQEVHDTLNSTIAILNGQMIVAYGQQGDVGAMERRAARLLAEISMPANILNEETKIRLRGEIATGAVQTYCTRGDLQNAERWAKTATAKWKVTSTSPHDEVRNTMVGIAGIMLQYFNSGDKEFPMRFRRWASIADHLWKEEEQEVPDRPVVAGLIQTCSEVQLYKAFTRDADGVHQWMKRLVTCADHPPYRSNPQICGEVASCLFNAVTTIWNEYPREEIRSWRLSLLELVSRFPDDAYIQTLGANIPDLWHTGWSQAIHEKTKHMLTSYTG
jgi:hypothetical protein